MLTSTWIILLHISGNWAWMQWCLCAAAPNYQLTVSAWAKCKLFDNPCMWHVSYCLEPAAQLGWVGYGGDLHQGFGLAVRMRCVTQAVSVSAVLQVPKAIMPDTASIWAKFSQKGVRAMTSAMPNAGWWPDLRIIQSLSPTHSINTVKTPFSN